MFVFVFVFVCALLYYIRFRRLRKPLYDLADNMPGVGDLPVLGHTHWFIGGPEKLLKNIRQLAEIIDVSGGITKMWIGPSLYIVSLEPEDVQIILENCLEKDFTYKFLRDWLGNGLFVAPYELWKTHRRLLLPLFHNRVVEDFIEVFGQQAKVLAQRLEEQVGKPEFDINKYITSCMLDVVFETAMGERMDVQHKPDTPYLRARSRVMSIINMRLFKAWLQPDSLFKLTNYAKIQKEDIAFTHKFTDEVVSKKRALYEEMPEEQVKEGRKDFLDLLLSKEGKFSDLQLREHIDSITIAGNDTTALVISYTLLLLGIYDDVQDKVYKEIISIFGDSDRLPTKDDLNKLEYLERVVKETMRLYTVVPIIARRTKKELKLTNFTLPAGVGCAVVPFVMHRSKRLWGPDADSFDPDRFLPENSADRHPCAFIPFSHGARNCIGRHFGWMVMKSILVTVLRKYEIKSRSVDRFKIEILLFPVPGHMITVEKRKPYTHP